MTRGTACRESATFSALFDILLPARFREVPTFRADLDSIKPYIPGRPIEEVAREIGIDPDSVVKLASNESPYGPFPGVVEAAAAALAESNRYPDNDLHDLATALAKTVGAPTDHLWFGAGSTGLISAIATAVGGPGTSSVYAWPSFVMYRIVSRIAMTEPIEVPLTPDMALDLEAMEAAVRNDTTLMYVCNPNNPTGRVVDTGSVERMIGSLPDRVLVVVDEAYHHYVDDPGYQTLIPVALETPNLVVLRTFSKIYGLATLRVGVAIGVPDTLAELRKTQAPFTVSQVAQVAATVSLGNDAELARRIAANAAARFSLTDALNERGIRVTGSETNFVFARLGHGSFDVGQAFTEHGVIIRPISGGWARITIGTPDENLHFLEALDRIDFTTGRN